VLVIGNEIRQAVLSCRVFGLGAEIGMMREACAGILRDHAEVVASVTSTGKNFVCLDIYTRLGFAQDGDLFRGSTVPEAPAWIHPA